MRMRRIYKAIYSLYGSTNIFHIISQTAKFSEKGYWI
jgi:hypothetical protein